MPVRRVVCTNCACLLRNKGEKDWFLTAQNNHNFIYIWLSCKCRILKRQEKEKLN